MIRMPDDRHAGGALAAVITRLMNFITGLRCVEQDDVVAGGNRSMPPIRFRAVRRLRLREEPYGDVLGIPAAGRIVQWMPA